MKQIGTYGQVKVAFVVIGIAVMSAIGGATFAHTHDQTTTAIALLVGATALTLYGRRILSWWWSEIMLDLETTDGPPTREYERTTRARTLAPKIVRMIEEAEGPVTVIVTGVEAPPTDGTPDAWGDALRSAARSGATVRLLLDPGTTHDEAAPARALGDAYPTCKVFALANTHHLASQWFYPTIAWEGDIKAPRQAVFWLEEAREAGETTTSAEFRNTRNLRRNREMLEEFLQSLERAAMRGLTAEQATTARG